jgi:hypothetical protein
MSISNGSQAFFAVAAGISIAFVLASAPSEAKQQSIIEAQKALMNREEMMVINLNRGPKSARFYMLQSLKSVRAIERDLERAQHQIEQVDATYAKVKNRSDDRTMQPTVERLKAALRTTQQLEQELDAAGDELKADVQQTLIK